MGEAYVSTSMFIDPVGVGESWGSVCWDTRRIDAFRLAVNLQELQDDNEDMQKNILLNS